MPLPKVNFVVYLLHFNPPLGRHRHYLGITRADTLKNRLDRHQALRGARLTRRALTHGCYVYLVRTWLSETPALETELKKIHDFRRLCPYCTPGIAIPPGFQQIVLKPVERPDPEFLDF